MTVLRNTLSGIIFEHINFGLGCFRSGGWWNIAIYCRDGSEHKCVCPMKFHVVLTHRQTALVGKMDLGGLSLHSSNTVFLTPNAWHSFDFDFGFGLCAVRQAFFGHSNSQVKPNYAMQILEGTRTSRNQQICACKCPNLQYPLTSTFPNLVCAKIALFPLESQFVGPNSLETQGKYVAQGPRIGCTIGGPRFGLLSV